ncbi:hypothetical protein ABLE68_17655 [Nocardioides sp. CN2-186]|uniref:hypothetical protein n=1 Tax=Nocardioides tweenelious TaxID=3156607 RepID=UPI0032B4ACC4
MKLRVAIAVAVGGFLVAGCSSSDDAPSADPGQPTSASPTAATTASATPAECQVAGFVPRTAIALQRQRPVVVYAHGITLAPGSQVGSKALDLNRADYIRLRVHADDPDATLTAADRAQILASGGGPVENGEIDDVVYGRMFLKNTGPRNQSYVVYRGSNVYSGTWTKRVCGAPYNDGTSVDRITGTYSTLSEIGPVKVAGCHVAASDSRIDRYAARRACRDF